MTLPAPDANARGGANGGGKPAVVAVQPRDINQGDLPGGAFVCMRWCKEVVWGLGRVVMLGLGLFSRANQPQPFPPLPPKKHTGGATRVWEGCAGEAVELGRLISPAGREMITVMDSSPMLAALPLKADLTSTASANRNARIKVGGGLLLIWGGGAGGVGMYVGAVAATPPSIRMSLVVGLRHTDTKTHPPPIITGVCGGERGLQRLAGPPLHGRQPRCVRICLHTRGLDAQSDRHDTNPKSKLITPLPTQTNTNLGDLVPFQTFRVSSLDGAAPTKAAIDSSAPIMVPLPKGVPSYSVVAAITGMYLRMLFYKLVCDLETKGPTPDHHYHHHHPHIPPTHKQPDTTAVPDGGAPVAHMFRIATGGACFDE